MRVTAPHIWLEKTVEVNLFKRDLMGEHEHFLHGLRHGERAGEVKLKIGKAFTKSALDRFMDKARFTSPMLAHVILRHRYHRVELNGACMLPQNL